MIVRQAKHSVFRPVSFEVLLETADELKQFEVLVTKLPKALLAVTGVSTQELALLKSMLRSASVALFGEEDEEV